MKVVAFNGSPRPRGNTFLCLSRVCRELEKEGITAEIVQLDGRSLRGCIGCLQCFENKNLRCAVETDDMNDHIEKMREADGILIGSPVYFGTVTAETKALLDRAGLVARANDFMFRRKVGAGVLAMRRGGASLALAAINNMFLINEMIVIGSIYWNFAFGYHEGEVENDPEGVATMASIGQNMAWALRKLAG